MAFLIDSEIARRVDRLELPFGPYGVDPFGIEKKALARSFSALAWLYRRYFRVRCRGIENVPRRGRAMLVGNHSGGVAVDGAMVLASCMLEMDPPRLAQGMAEKFIAGVPFASTWAARCGQFTGLPEHAERLLREDRLLMVFPEGSRGTAKLYPERNSLVDFGTGFVRLAMQTKSPIVPFGFVGGGDAIPTVFNAYRLGKMLGVPYIPFTPYGFALPLPVSLGVIYGRPMSFEGTGREDDEVVQVHVDKVKRVIASLIEEGQRASPPRLLGVGS